MPATARKSELYAINRILSRAGIQPVNSLDDEDALPRDATRALEIFRDIIDEIQEDPDLWHVTTEKEQTLQPDTLDGNRIAVATNVVSISRNKLVRHGNQELTLRGSFVYDITKSTFAFENDIKVDLRIMLEWDDLPVQLRRYIWIRAAREYQESWVKDVNKHNFDVQAELEAKSKALANEIREQNLSMLQKPQTLRDNNRFV